jgi:hypothetical protein
MSTARHDFVKEPVYAKGADLIHVSIAIYQRLNPNPLCRSQAVAQLIPPSS